MEKSKKEQVEQELYQARKAIDIAMSAVHKASNSGIGFELSKPLNILYKELDAHRQLLGVYIGERKAEDYYSTEVAEPQSWKAYKNMNLSSED